MLLPQIHDAKELESLAEELGFLPFFANEVPGFSIEECCPKELWFADTADGPWEWKGPLARGGKCVYGKFFRGRAGFVSLEFFPHFANWRRDGYDFDARYEDALAPRKDKEVYDVIAAHGSLLSKELKRICNYRKGANTGFDTVITRLQMESYVTIADFEYSMDKYGRTYGWGVARYTTPEAQFGYDAVTACYSFEPQESRERVFARLRKIAPHTEDSQLIKLMG